MRKIGIILIIFVILLTACTDNSTSLYIIKLTSPIEGGIFNSSKEIYQISNSVKENKIDIIETTIHIGKQTIIADHTAQTKNDNIVSSDIYTTKDGTVEYKISKNSNSFFISAKNGTVLSEYKENNITEDTLLKNVNDFIDSYLDSTDYSEYNCSCTTSITVQNEDSAWKETKNNFYIPSSENETVTSYNVEFREYYNNVATANSIVVYCDGRGNITNFYHYDYDADWSTFTFDENKINNSIESFLDENLNSAYSLKKYTIRNQQLVYRNEKVQLLVTVELTLDNENTEIELLCPLLLL